MPFLSGSVTWTAPCGLDYSGGVALRRQVLLLVSYGGLSQGARRVFGALWDLMRPDGTICPTRADIAELLEMGVRQVDRLKGELWDNHVLRWHNRKRCIRNPDGTCEWVQTSNCYTLTLPPCGYVSPSVIDRKKEAREEDVVHILPEIAPLYGPPTTWEMERAMSAARIYAGSG